MIDAVETLLTDTRTWAVVGCSPKPDRDSHNIARLLQSWGFRVVPVNAQCADDEILGECVYASLADIPGDVVMDRCPAIEMPRLRARS